MALSKKAGNLPEAQLRNLMQPLAMANRPMSHASWPMDLVQARAMAHGHGSIRKWSPQSLHFTSDPYPP